MGHCIDARQDLHDRLGFWPNLLFDRGLGTDSIIEHLHAAGATFYIRLKAEHYVGCDGQKTKIEQLPAKDATVELFGLTLRVVRSPKSRRAKQPWYILTNDQASSRTKIVRIYYHRFEIEETFKDTKHLFELQRLSFTRPTSLKVVLWLVFIGLALLYVITTPTKQLTATAKPRQQTSLLRQAYEQLAREVTRYRGMTSLTHRQSA